MIKKLFKTFLFLIGFILCVYPLFSSFINDLRQEDILSSYEKVISVNENTLDKEKEKAIMYNKAVYDKQNGIINNEINEILSKENYNNVYDITGSGIIGSIEIPKIKLKLPIYHGTDEKTLASGAGHLEGTSFPTGEPNTKSVITGHRGLPDANLFLRLDEVKEDDVFYIKIGDEKIAYKVINIKVVEPDDEEVTIIEDNRNLVSLVTCTPYGLNTHRLIVTGQRSNEIKSKDSINEVKNIEVPSVRRGVMNFLPFIFLAVAVIKLIKRKRRD